MRPLDLVLRWEPEPVLVTLAVAAALYLTAARRVRRWPAARTAAWLGGLLALALALASGIEADDDLLLSAHMVQHLLLTVVAPPLLLVAGPVPLALRALRPPARRRLARALQDPRLRAACHPAGALVAFTAVQLVTHLTPLYGLAVRDDAVHLAEHTAYFATGLLFWAPLVAPAPTPHRLSPIAALAYIMIAMPGMVVVGMYLAAPAVRYGVYLRPARELGVSALGDQHLAAALMLAGGVLPLLAATFGSVWPAMLREERRLRTRAAYERRAGAA